MKKQPKLPTENTIIEELRIRFPKNEIDYEMVCGRHDFSPRVKLIVDGEKTPIVYDPELAQDIAHCLVTHRLKLDPLDPMTLCLPIEKEDAESVLGELVEVLTNSIKDFIEEHDRENKIK